MYIQEISKELQLSKKAINLYEEKGLIQPQKDSKGYRLYGEKERKILLQVKQLRKLGFTIDEIKAVLLENKYEIFDQKKLEYQTQSFQLNTSIQYIDKVKETMTSNGNLDDLFQEINDVFALEEQFNFEDSEIDFDKLVICLIAFAWICTMKTKTPYISEIISTFCMISAILIYASSTIRVFLYKIIKYFHK